MGVRPISAHERLQRLLPVVGFAQCPLVFGRFQRTSDCNEQPSNHLRGNQTGVRPISAHERLQPINEVKTTDPQKRCSADFSARAIATFSPAQRWRRVKSSVFGRFQRTSDCNSDALLTGASQRVRCSADFSARAIATSAATIVVISFSWVFGRFQRTSDCNESHQLFRYGQLGGVRPISAHERLQLLLYTFRQLHAFGVRPISAHERLQLVTRVRVERSSVGVRPISAHERLQRLAQDFVLLDCRGGVRPISAHERLQLFVTML